MPAFDEKPMESESNLAQDHSGDNRTQFSVLNKLQQHLSSSGEQKTVYSLIGRTGSGKTRILREIERQFGAAFHLAYFDLAAGSCAGLVVENPISALLFLRTNLSHNYFFSPLFDLLIASWLFQQGNLNRRSIRENFPARDRLFIAQLWELLENENWMESGNDIINCFRGLLKTQLVDYMRSQKLTAENITDYLRYPLEIIPDILPRVLAGEINFSAQLSSTPEKTILLFDNYPHSDGEFAEPAAKLVRNWLHDFIRHLNLQQKTVLVFAAGATIQLEDFLSPEITSNRCELLPVEASDIINNAAAKKIWLQNFPQHEYIFSCLQRQKDQLSPYEFGICFDIISTQIKRDKAVEENDFSAACSSFKKSQFHMRKLLYLTGRENAYAMIALSAARWFDQSLYLYLGEKLNFEATQQGFMVITNYSFTEAVNGQAFTAYRFNAKASDDIQSYSTKALVDSHFILERFFLKKFEKGDKSAICEAIYHLSQANWEKATVKWVTTFEDALKANDTILLHGLISTLADLPRKSLFWQGRVFQNIASFLQLTKNKDDVLHYLKIARRSFDTLLQDNPDDADAVNSKGVVIFQQGKVLQENGALSQSTSSFAEAMICFSQLVEKNKSPVAAQLNNILIHIVKAQGYALLDQSDERIKQLELASEKLEKLLHNAPTLLPAINTFARLQMKLAREYQQLHQDDLVFKRMDNAIELFKSNFGTTNTPAALLRAHAQTHWDAACIYADYGAYYDADHYFKSAIGYAKKFSLNEQNLQAVLFLSEIQNAFATLQLKYMQLTSALTILQDAATNLTSQRWAYPKNRDINNILGSISLQKAEVFMLTYDYGKATDACTEARHYFNTVLWFDKSDIRAKQGIALVTARQAAITITFSDYKNARLQYENAKKLIDIIPVEQLSVEQFSNALNLHLENAAALFDSGVYDAAIDCYAKTDQLYQKHRNYFPATNSLQIIKAKYLLGMAKIHLLTARYMDAAEMLDTNLVHLQKILKGAPNHLNAMLLKVEVYQVYCQLHVDLGKTGKAIESVSLALQILEMTLENGITIPDVMNGKARVLTVLATIQGTAGYFDQAKENLQLGLNLYDDVLGSAELDLNANAGKTEIYLKMAELSLQTAKFELSLKYCSYANDQLAHKDVLQKNPLVCRLKLDISLLKSRIYFAGTRLKDAENELTKLDRALESATGAAPDEYGMRLIKIDSLLLRAAIFDRSGKTDGVLNNCNSAIENLEKLANTSRDSVVINNNLGLAKTQLANCYISQGASQKATEMLRKAISAFDGVLKFAPENAVLKNNKANVLQQLATVFAATEGSAAAAEMLNQAAEIYEQLAAQNENETTALYNRGLTAAKSAYIFTSLQNVEAALGAFKKAITCFETVIEIAPAQVDFHQKKGDAYLGSGLLFLTMKKTNESMQCLKTAVDAFDTALQLREDNSHSLYSRGKTLLHLGELQNQIGEKGQALWSYQQACECFVRLLDYDKSQLQVIKNLADVNLAIGELQVSFSQHNDAFAHYLNAVKLYDVILGTEQENGQVKFNQALAN